MLAAIGQVVGLWEYEKHHRSWSTFNFYYSTDDIYLLNHLSL